MADVAIRIGSLVLSGWKSCRVEAGLDRAAGAFQMSVSAPPDLVTALKPDAACQVMINDAVAITGHIDSVDETLTATSHTVTVAGRDRAADLVDCAALRVGDGLGQFSNQTLVDIVKALAEPYEVTVTVDAGLQAKKRFAQFAIEPGESAWDAIERAARQRGVLVMSDTQGGIVLTRAGRAVAAGSLVLGSNVRELTFSRNHSQRFNRYLCLGQSSSNVYGDAAAASHIQTVETDSACRKPRTMLLVAEDQADGESARDRIRWERNVRRARARNVSLVTDSFTTAGGDLWRTNTLVWVKAPALRLNAQLLIESVAFQLDEQGRRTELRLVPPSVYDMEPLPEETQQQDPLVDWGVEVTP